MAPSTSRSDLGQLGLLPPEIRDYIYAMIPADKVAEIGTPCQPRSLRLASKALGRDLCRTRRECRHKLYTMTYARSSSETADHKTWLRTRLARMRQDDSQSHDYDSVNYLSISVKDANDKLPSLAYSLDWLYDKQYRLRFPGTVGDNSGHESYPGLGPSFHAAAECILTGFRIMSGTQAVDKLDHESARRLEHGLQRYTVPDLESGSRRPLKSFCTMATVKQAEGDGIEFHHPHYPREEVRLESGRVKELIQ